MQRQILRLSGFEGTDDELELKARKRTIAAVPQRLYSYPMHLREHVMTLNPKYFEKYTAPPTAPPVPKENDQPSLEDLKKHCAPPADTD